MNPVIDPSLERDGALTFGNAAVTAGVAEAPASYTLQWFRFDNATDTRENVGDAGVGHDHHARQPPAALLSGGGDYIGVTITANHPTHPAWAKPATFYFRRSAGGWTWVGAERGVVSADFEDKEIRRLHIYERAPRVKTHLE